MGDILIIKNRGDRMEAKVRKRTHKGFSPDDYLKVINPQSAEDLSTLFEDLNLLYNSPIEKAFMKYHDKKNRGLPF